VNDKVKTFIRDAIEGAITVVVALQVAFPNSLAEAKSIALTVFVAVAGAVIAAARRDLLPYLLEKIAPGG
jgi:hypothetical protein